MHRRSGGRGRSGRRCANGRQGGKKRLTPAKASLLGRTLYSTRHSLLQGVWPVVLRLPLDRCGLASVRSRIATLHRRCDAVDFSHPACFTLPRCEFQSAPHRPLLNLIDHEFVEPLLIGSLHLDKNVRYAPTSLRVSYTLQPSHCRHDVTGLTRIAPGLDSYRHFICRI